MTPWPTAYTFLGTQRLIILEAKPATPALGGAPPTPGTIVSLSPFVVVCGEGALEIKSVRPEGKRAMTAAEFVAGHPMHPGLLLA